MGVPLDRLRDAGMRQGMGRHLNVIMDVELLQRYWFYIKTTIPKSTPGGGQIRESRMARLTHHMIPITGSQSMCLRQCAPCDVCSAILDHLYNNSTQTPSSQYHKSHSQTLSNLSSNLASTEWHLKWSIRDTTKLSLSNLFTSPDHCYPSYKPWSFPSRLVTACKASTPVTWLCVMGQSQIS
jgi:hypothetical protein